MASSNAACVLGGVRLISSASTIFAKRGPSLNLKNRLPVAWSSSSISVPIISVGMRSGVNCIRRKERFSACDKVRTISVFASPGTPSSKQCPPASKATINSSRISSCPTITFCISLFNCDSLLNNCFKLSSDNSNAVFLILDFVHWDLDFGHIAEIRKLNRINEQQRDRWQEQFLHLRG